MKNTPSEFPVNLGSKHEGLIAKALAECAAAGRPTTRDELLSTALSEYIQKVNEHDMPPIIELQVFLKDVETKLRPKRMYSELLNIEVAETILFDVATVESKASSRAYDIEQAIIETEKLINSITSGLELSAEKTQTLDLVRRHLGRCVERAHLISEALKHADKVVPEPETE